MNIRLLDENTINKIAAGEVIERPASALKELLENSSDGGATRIEVEFDQGGKTLLKVSDNGAGIAEADLVLALQRHATSKIIKIDDLSALETFGFRGEALSSLAAVSELTLHSGHQGAGAVVEARGGKIETVKPAPAISGTQITIRNLFYNVPARLKFLKSDAGETAAVKKVIRAFALSHPEINITLRQGGKAIAVFERDSFLKRACRVLGLSEKDVVLVEKTEGSMRAHMVLSHPHLNLATQQGLWIFVQGRPIQDRSLQQAILEGYRNLIMGHQYPQVVLKLEVDPAEVDVNVHPTKAQVKFLNTSAVFRFVSHAIKEAMADRLEAGLSESRLLSLPAEAADRPLPPPKRPAGFHHETQQVLQNLPPSIGTDIDIADLVTVAQYNQRAFDRAVPSAGGFAPWGREPVITDSATRSSVKPNVASRATGPWSSNQVIGQYANTYIVAQSRTSLVLVDQHAAHERVLFESLKSKTKFEKQYALLEDLVELNRESIEALTEPKFADVFNDLGFEMTDRGPTTLAVSAKPAFLLEVSLKPLFERIAEQILDVGSTSALDDVITDIWASMACHGAIRAGRVLTIDEMNALFKQMDDFTFSSFCPHGRPVSVTWGLTELERLFKRIV